MKDLIIPAVIVVIIGLVLRLVTLLVRGPFILLDDEPDDKVN